MIAIFLSCSSEYSRTDGRFRAPPPQFPKHFSYPCDKSRRLRPTAALACPSCMRRRTKLITGRQAISARPSRLPSPWTTLTEPTVFLYSLLTASVYKQS